MRCSAAVASCAARPGFGFVVNHQGLAVVFHTTVSTVSTEEVPRDKPSPDPRVRPPAPDALRPADRPAVDHVTARAHVLRRTSTGAAS